MRTTAIRLTPVLVWMGAACSGLTEPDDFDPGAAADVVAELLRNVSDNPGVKSLVVVGTRLGLPSTTPNGRARSARPLSVLEPALGRTLIYNPQSNVYELDLDATGAPPNGVRFRLYRIDNTGRAFLLPLETNGHLDLTDESTDADRLGVETVVDGTIALQYESSSSGNLFLTTLVHTLDGSLTGTLENVGLKLEQRASETAGISVDYRIAGPQESMRFQLSFDAGTAIATSTLTVEFDGRTLSMTTTGTPMAIEGEVRDNDRLVARIAGTSDEPVFVDSDGVPITGGDLTALNAIFTSADEMVVLMDVVQRPSYWVFGLDLIFGS